MLVVKQRSNTAVHVLLPMILTILLQWNAISQTTWEFSGMPYDYQKTHFDSATEIMKIKLGLQMRTFGAPYNQIDATLIQVMSEDTNYKVLLFGQLNPAPASGQINLTNRVFIESATGVPDYNYFLSSWYSKKTTYTDYMVMQGHPYAWTTPEKLTAFQNIVNFLIATDSVVFTTPYDYYRYLNDPSIPRTSKIQVILKLDDFRATTSYFFPCLPTYDFLAVNKIKAGFGVNKMEALTQSQIDTLQYYLSQTNSSGEKLFEIWNHGLDHSMTAISSGGNWSSPLTWPSGYVPTSADDVIIPAGVTITIDSMNAICNNLTIEGVLVTSLTNPTALIVNGDVLVNAGGSFTSPSLTGAAANILHSLTVYGDFTNDGGTFDFRTGSAGTTMRVINTTFLGNYNSTISVGTYLSSNNDFNSITVNKTNGAKLICASDVVVDPGASTCVSQLILTYGIIETGNKAIYVLSTTSANIVSASSLSYINGALGRGMSNSAGKSCPFPVGDSRGYRPITVTSATSGVATGHYVLVRCIPENANTGIPAFTGGIDAVSKVRYYQISYNKGIGSGAPSMGFNTFSPSYGTDDGVRAGNTDLRVAFSKDNLSTWIGMSQAIPHTTSLSSPPTTITPEALAVAETLYSGTGSLHIALSKITGSTTNPLMSPPLAPELLLPANGVITQPTTITLRCHESVDADTYQFQLATDSLFILPLTSDSIISDTSFNVTGLAQGTKYFWRVNAINPGGASNWSGVWNFTTYIPAPLEPELVSPFHNATNQPTTLPLIWNAAEWATTYHLQVALDTFMTTLVLDDTTLASTTFVASDLVNNRSYYWRVRAKSPGGRSEWSAIYHFTTINATVDVDLGLSSGWNLVSVPVNLETYEKDSLFPASVSPAYYYASTYIEHQTLVQGNGYWIKYAAPQIVHLNGICLDSLKITLVQGWNLIGSISFPIATSSIVSDDSSLTVGNFFGYTTAYVHVDTLQPGGGYWVKANKSGAILLSSTSDGVLQHGITIIPTLDLPPVPPSNDALPALIPSEYRLGQNYPNPFNPITKIEYQLPEDSRVTMTIFNTLGQLVATIINGDESIGYRSVEWDASDMSSGLYYCRINAVSLHNSKAMFTEVKKMMFLK